MGRRDSVRMLTTAGIAVVATSRKVPDVTGPVIGALLIGGGAPSVWADELGDSPSRDDTTSVAAAEATATSSA
jgi:hypothetical protein